MSTPTLEIVYRAMKMSSNGLPLTGRSARMLGVRIGGSNADISVDSSGCVIPNTGGMSVAPDSPQNLPKHRLPQSLGGEGRDPVFQFSLSRLTANLQCRRDTVKHALLEPRHRCELAVYEQHLCDTQSQWSLV